MSASAFAELLLVALPKTFGLLTHLLVNVLLALVVLVLATRFQVEFIDAPVFQIIREGDDAHLLHQVKFTRSVEIQDGRKGARVAVEEILIVH